MHTDNIILLISVTLILSYISTLMYSKTKIPDILWLMGFGLLVGPVLNLFDKGLFLSLAPMMSVVALSVILFEAGINVDITLLFENMGKAAILSITSIIASILFIGLTLSWMFPADFTLPQAMLLGAMVGGTSTVSVYGIMSGLSKTVKNLSGARVLLTMESIISDPVCIIASITIIRMIMLPDVSLRDSARDIFYVFTVASIFGLAVGLLWALILDRLRNRPFTYMITLSVLLPVYVLTELFVGEGGGAMSALTFGLAIANFRYFTGRLGWNTKVKIDKQKLREFHEEITFFIKSFFFVYIGLVVSLSIRYTVIGFAMVLLLMFIRFILVEVLDWFIDFSPEEKIISQFVYASGLPAFVMSQLPLILDPDGLKFSNTAVYPNIAMPIVLGTVIYSALLGPYVIQRELLGGKKPVPVKEEPPAQPEE
jgi:cell volume regulation protein A